MINKFNETIFDYDGNVLKIGDNVIIIFLGKDYEKTGVIYELNNNGYCGIVLDDNGEKCVYWRTNLIKISNVVNIKTGEVFIVPNINMKDLIEFDFVEYDMFGNFFYFRDSNFSRVQNYFY